MIHQLVDIASVAHLFNFMVLGLLFPSNYIGALFLGIAWECLEECLTKQEFSKGLLIQHFKDYQHLWKEGKKNKCMDIALNMIGYYVGNKIRGYSPL
jgi:hypothetical protein